MALVNVINVLAHDSKGPFASPVKFEIFFEAQQNLKFRKFIHQYLNSIALTWRIIYIGQASNPEYD